MQRTISRSYQRVVEWWGRPTRRHWFVRRRSIARPIALVLGVAAFVLLYETQILDSQRVAWMFGRATPAPGALLDFSATAYCKGSVTASGVPPRTGVAAADPALLPVGSVVNIATGDAKYNGVYTVMDTGPEVKGRELDLYIWSCIEALTFGRRPVRITVLRLGWDPKASSPTLVDRLFRRREASQRAPKPEPPPPAGLPPAPEVDEVQHVVPADLAPGDTELGERQGAAADEGPPAIANAGL